MNMTRKIIMAATVLTLLFGLCASFWVSGEEVPYESYTYWEDTSAAGSRKAVYAKPSYTVKTVVSAASLGVKEFKQLSDICTDSSGNLYLLDGGNSRLIIADSNHTLVGELKSLNYNGEQLNFEGARSVYVHTDGTIYICDTDNQRVLLADAKGTVTDILTLPDSNLIPDDFRFLPIKVAVDSYGYTYVLSDGSYYGALLYTADNTFSGFYGANKVKGTLTDALSSLWSRLFVNNKKKEASVRALPYCFVDICIDAENFVYTATGFTDISQMTGQIKKLNPGGGSNVLNSDDVNFVDEGVNTTFDPGQMLKQDIGGVAVDNEGFMYCLDTTYGRVFLYDQECRLLTTFGGGMGTGEQAGTFKAANAIALRGSEVLVCDGIQNTVTVFQSTPYGALLRDTRALTLSGKYQEAKADWEEILRQDRNCQLAYSGLARAYLAEGEYTRAMTLARQGCDRDTYALAFDKQRNAFLTQYFWILLPCGLVLIGGLLTVLVLSMRKKLAPIKNKQLRLMLNTAIRPVQSFNEIKEKKEGSLLLCGVLVLLYYILSVLQELCGGFLFTFHDPSNFNSLWVLARSVGLIVLWIVSNKAVCTLMEGKGRLRDIAIVTCYSLIPVILGRVLFLVLSNILLPSEAEFLGILQTVMFLYTLLLLTIGTIKIHDYSMGRFLGTSALTVFGIAVIVFLVIMIGILMQQFFGFLVTLFLEMTM